MTAITLDHIKKMISCERERIYTYNSIADELGYELFRLCGGLPEVLSENIIRLIIKFKLGDNTCTWSKEKKEKKENNSGDLVSEIDGRIEAKSFTSSAPLSFGPKERWDKLYFLDARKWLDDQFILYKLNCTNQNFKNIRVNKKETYGDQIMTNRRPRICWNALKPQLCKGEHGTFERIFSGSLDSIGSEQLSQL